MKYYLIILLWFIFLIILLLAAKYVHANTTRDELQRTIRDVQQRESARTARRKYLARVQRVTRFLADSGSPLKPYAEDFVRCGDAYGLKPSLLVGITFAESSGGLYYQLANNPSNWNVHGGTTFRSMGEGICHVAKGIKQNYDTSSVYAISLKYAPVRDGNQPSHWTAVVEGVIRELGV